MPHSVSETFSSFPLELDGGDHKSDRDIAERRARYVELAAFMNADPDEIGVLHMSDIYYDTLFSFCASLCPWEIQPAQHVNQIC